MPRRKQSRYTAAEDCPLLIQSGKDFFTSCKGRWREEYFHNNNPIVLELACGRGEYTVWLSQVYPDKNFIGVDIKAERMMVGIQSYKSQVISCKWYGEWENLTLNTHNLALPKVAFLRTIIHHIDQFFAPGEVDEIWIVHPDPRPKNRDIKRRLTSPRFLAMYYSLLSDGGLLRLKTDDGDLFSYSVEEIEGMRDWKNPAANDGTGERMRELVAKTDDLYNSPLLAEHHGIRTHYETMFVEQGRTIHYGVWKKV